MNLTKLKNGDYRPSYPSDQEESAKIKVGEEVRASRDRNPEFHRKFFSLLKLGFENQDRYADKEIFRSVMIMKAGFVHWVPGKDGAEHPLPMSISFDSMGQAEFERLFKAVLEVISKEIAVNKKDVLAELENYQ